MELNNLSPLYQNPIDFDLLQFRQYKTERLIKNNSKKIFALDTETYNGYCKLIADNLGFYEISPSLENENNNDIDIFLNMMTSHRYRSNINFFFNLNYDVNAIIKYLPKENLLELYNGCELKRFNSKTKKYGLQLIPNTTIYKDYRIFYIPRKILRITKDKHVYKFFDIAQFYNMSLEKSAKKYLGLDKYIDKVDRKKLGTDRSYWLRNTNMIIDYCINDSVLTAELGKLLYDKLSNNLKLNPSSFTSKAGITKEFVRKTVNIPDVRKIPNNVLKYAFKSYSGGRFEVIEKGYLGKCSLYDINSAYPYTISNLLDITKGKWKWVTSLNENAEYGFYLVKVFVKYNKICPIGIQTKNGLIVYPVFEGYTYLTKNELLAYENYIDYEIIDGWEFKTDKKVYPFRKYILDVYDLKNNTDKKLFEYDLYKILMNSVYGCFYEKIIQNTEDVIKILTGKLFNPIYASLITSETKIDLFKTSIPYFDDVIAYATDSILFKNDVEITTSKDLGKWDNHSRLENTTVLKGGIYQIGHDLKNRGIKKADYLKTPFGEYKDIFDYIKRNPSLNLYPIITTRPLTFIEVLLHHLKYNLQDINVFKEMVYNIDLNKDLKRIWDDEFLNGGELFNKSITSIPLLLN